MFNTSSQCDVVRLGKVMRTRHSTPNHLVRGGPVKRIHNAEFGG